MMLDNYFNQTKILESTAEKSIFWLKSNEAVYNDIDKALGGFNELQFAIPIFGGSGDKFSTIQPWHHIFFEAEQDLDSAILLLLTGFYKDSFRSIRSFLELHVFALYNFVDEDNNDFQDWLHGKKHTPRLGDLIKTLNKKSEAINILNQKLGWDNEVELLYRELSGFMHTRGASHTHTSLRSSNQTVFSETGIKAGTSLLLKAIRLAGMGSAVSFPMSFQSLPLFDKFAFSQPAGGFLDEGQVKNIKAMFPDNTSREILEICLSDDNATSLAEEVKSMPDLTKEEVFNSFKQTLESEEFKNSKEEILQMIKNDELGRAFSLVLCMQRAMMRSINGILFNPFYEAYKDK